VTSAETSGRRRSEQADVDVVVVGAGFAGLYAVYRLRGLGLEVRGIEAGDGVGGTWYWNRYPGCRCDVPSLEYSYSFDEVLEREWSFPETMSTQPEIERYLNHVADRHDLRRTFRFGTRVTAATFDEATSTWTVETDNGDRYTARWCVMATGPLSIPNLPELPGIESFTGRVVHTGLWPREGVDVEGLRVGVIGTGSSGTQVIPRLAETAGHLTVFQRTPNYAFPAAVAPMDPVFEAHVKTDYRKLREMQRASSFGISGFVVPSEDGTEDTAVGAGALADLRALADPVLNRQVHDQFAQMVRDRVHDPETAAALIPTDYPVGCKRLVQEVGYFETFNLEHVTLVDLRGGGITGITPSGVGTEQGHFELDVLVFATGFDAVTGPLKRVDIRGRGGRALNEKWSDGPTAYLGLLSSGFPNLFMINGPGSPSVLSNMAVSCEQHVELIAEIIEQMRANGYSTIDAEATAELEWADHVQEVAAGTQFTAPACKSWYLGSNIEGKRRVFLPYVGGVNQYIATCKDVVQAGFRGFVLTAAPIAVTQP
jgi:cyclohexanone monooxygenase